MSPLIKRLPRELVHNIGKYLGIFLLMAVSIALTSGFLLAAHSISVIIDDMPETYVIEDGRFTTAFEATDEQLDAVRDVASDSGGIELYKNYSFDAGFEKTQGDNARNCTVRTFEHRTQVDLAAYAQGGEPRQQTKSPLIVCLQRTTMYPWATRSRSTALSSTWWAL